MFILSKSFHISTIFRNNEMQTNTHNDSPPAVMISDFIISVQINALWN
jgi:hypothetical protein